MKTHFKLLIFILLLPFALIAGTPIKTGKYVKEKKIHKEFTVNSSAALQVNNSYGNIDIVTWDQNKTVIDVHIITQGDDEDAVIKKLKSITVDFSGNLDLVTATTLFSESNSGWSSLSSFWKSGTNDVNMEINYTIKLPKTNSLALDNDYGTISITSLKGSAKINCDYGQLIIGELLADNNELNFDYTTKSTINYMKGGKIDADYSSFTLDKVIRLDLNADYTTSEIGEVSYLEYNCDYGKVLVEKAEEIIAKGDYVTNKFQSISKRLKLNSDYSSVYVGELKPTVKEVSIDSEFTGIKMGLHPEASFDFTINIEFASLKGEEILIITKNQKDYTDKNYKGYFGTQNSGNSLFIASEYGGVTLFKL